MNPDDHFDIALRLPNGVLVRASCDDVVSVACGEELAAVMARVCGVPRELFEEWALWVKDGCHCTAIKRDGKACRSDMSGDHSHMGGPSGFERGITDRCRHHQEDEA